jgi:hypothetical protein
MNFKKYPIFFPAWADLRGKNTWLDGICLTGPNPLGGLDFVRNLPRPAETRCWLAAGVGPRALLGRFGFAGHGHKADRQHGMILDYSA